MNDIELIDYLLKTVTPGINNCIQVGTIEISISLEHIEEGIDYEVFEHLYKEGRYFYLKGGFLVVKRNKAK